MNVIVVEISHIVRMSQNDIQNVNFKSLSKGERRKIMRNKKKRNQDRGNFLATRKKISREYWTRKKACVCVGVLKEKNMQQKQ